jgi:MFS transporter, LPLT family, lysophospholipid transporter
VKEPLNPGFYTIMGAQFFSSLADNALLIAAIAMLMELNGPAWMTPFLKIFFTLSYVLLAAFVGAFADSRPKGKVMFSANTVKILGCLLMLLPDRSGEVVGNTDYLIVLIAYGIVGVGAATYSPAKYGIVTELLPARQLVVANGWIEGLTVLSIILGTVLGGVLIGSRVSGVLLTFGMPHVNNPAEAAMGVIIGIYLIAAIFNLFIPDTGARYSRQHINPLKLLKDFSHCLMALWRDKLGQISLAATTLLWGAGAVLQFIVLKWAEESLGLGLEESAIMQGTVAIGIALGAVLAAKWVKLENATRVLPLGIAMGISLTLMNLVTTPAMAYPLLIVVGAMAGFFLVPMNALLQHRGYILLSAGHSIAVQNFNENLNILVMLGLYAAMVWLDLPVRMIIIIFSVFVALVMWLLMRWARANRVLGGNH